MAIGETLGLYFEIAADPSKAIRAVSDFQNSIEKSLGMSRGSVGLIAQDIEKKWGLASGSLLKTGVAAQAAVKDLAYLTAGAGALAAGALVLADRWATAGTEIFEAAEKTGMSASNLSGLRTSAKLLGEDFGTLTVILARMGRNIEAGLRDPSSEAGKSLGLLYKSSNELQKLGLMPLDQRIADVNKRIFALGNVSQQNILLQAEAGRGYMAVRSVLQDLGQNGYDPLILRAKQLKQYFDDESARQARQFKIEMAEMKAEMDGLALAVGQKAVPALSQLFSLLETKLDSAKEQGFWKTAGQGVRDYAAGMFKMNAEVLTLHGGFGLFSGQIDSITSKIAGGAKETQHMTDRLVSLNSMAAAAAKGTGELGNTTKKTSSELSEGTQQMLAAIRSYGDLNRSLQVQLDAGSNTALKRYLETNNKILELSSKLDTTYLRQLNRQIFQKESTEELTKAESTLNAELAKHIPTYQFNLQAMTQLTAAERLRLPLILDENSALAQMLQNSQSVVNEMLQEELPARQRINLQIQRQIDTATREIEFTRQEYREGKITLAQKEAAELQYTAVYSSLTRQRTLALQRETDYGLRARLQQRQQLQQLRQQLEETQASFLSLEVYGVQAFMQLGQAMGTSTANAIVYGESIGKAMAQALKATLASIAGEALVRAIYSTGLGFYLLAIQDYPGAAKAFTSAAIFATIGGVAAGIGRVIPNNSSTSSSSSSTSSSSGSSSATSTETERGPVINVYVDGVISSDNLDEVIYQINDRVNGSGVVLHASVARRVEAKS